MQKYHHFYLIIILFLFFTGCTLRFNNNHDLNNADPSDQQTTKKSYSFQEVSQHNQATDCWLLIDNKVYDVTSFVATHPGGKAIIEGCGKDATKLFETRPMGSGTAHSQNARRMLNKYYIGDLIK